MPTAASLSFADVATAIAAANYGDIVTLPAGTSPDWGTNYHNITKYMTISGAGKGVTTISGTGSQFFTYTPDATSLAANAMFKIGGFTLNGNYADVSSTYCLGLWQTEPAWPGTVAEQDKIVIHDIDFYHCKRVLAYAGNFYGVMYDCDVHYGTGLSTDCIFLGAMGLYRESWEYHYPGTVSKPFGTGKNFYIEDCTFDGKMWCEAGHGGRYVIRHCAFTNQLEYQTFDAHGNQGGGIYGTVITEIYDNTIAMGFDHSMELFTHRGGAALCYNNVVTGGSQTPYSFVRVTDENADNQTSWPLSASLTMRPEPGYCWSNTGNGTAFGYYEAQDPADNGGVAPGDPATGDLRRDKTYFDDILDDSFDTSSGIGVGLLAARPTITLTTDIGALNYAPVVGTAYWATDTNTLYRVTSAGAWETYYTPYEYPHPLQSETENPPYGFSHSEKVVLTVSANEVGRLYVDIPKKRAVVGTSVVYVVHAEPWNDFVGNITLDITGLPSGATDSYGTNPIAYDGSTAATVTTVGVVAGTYYMEITGTSAGGDVASVRVVLEIVGGADADIKIPIKKIRAKRGDNAVFTIMADSLPGYTSDVDLSVSGVPAGASSSFGDASLAYNGTTTLTIDTGTADLGEHDVIITGVGPG